MMKFTAASFSGKSFFYFLHSRLRGRFHKAGEGLCLPGRKAGQEAGRGGLWARRGGGSSVQVCGQVWPGAALPHLHPAVWFISDLTYLSTLEP